MSRLNDSISNVAYILDALMAYRNIVDSGDCNRCGKKKTCEYIPKVGQLVRYNCPFYKQEQEAKHSTETSSTHKALDTISRQAAIDIVAPYDEGREMRDALEDLPSVQPERCEYYALCRHGRDENKLRSALGCCDYCTEDSDGYVKPIEKNSHAFIRFGMDGWELNLRAKGWHGSAKIRYCPMCGRRLERG